jgi:hypothetical protein
MLNYMEVHNGNSSFYEQTRPAWHEFISREMLQIWQPQTRFSGLSFETVQLFGRALHQSAFLSRGQYYLPLLKLVLRVEILAVSDGQTRLYLQLTIAPKLFQPNTLNSIKG